MNENTENKDPNPVLEKEKQVDELSGFYFSSAIKIFDPNTDEVLVHKRGDN